MGVGSHRERMWRSVGGEGIRLNAGPSTARADAPLPSTASSFEVRARALRALEEHRVGMQRSAQLVARSRALCRGGAAVRGDTAASIPARARSSPAPRLRVVPGGAPAPAPAPAPARACMHLGCCAPATVAPRVVLCFPTHEVALAGLPLRVCAVHADDLTALVRSDGFQEALRSSLRRRGREEPVAVRFAFVPIR